MKWNVIPMYGKRFTTFMFYTLITNFCKKIRYPNIVIMIHTPQMT